MKKVLFLTTALIATGSMAAADVRISGYGRFGLDYNRGNKTATSPNALALTVPAAGSPLAGPLTGTVTNQNLPETSITSRLRLQFDYSAETDGGVSFGGRNRFQIESRDNRPRSPQGMNGARFFVSWAGFTVAAGNILGAIDGGMRGIGLATRTAGAGIDGMGFQDNVANMAGFSFNYDAYSSAGAGANGVEAIYNADNWGVHFSYSQRNDTNTITGTFTDVPPVTWTAATTTVTQGEANTGISGYYIFENFQIAAGYNDEDRGPTVQGNDQWFFSASTDFGVANVRIAYSQIDNVTTTTSGDASKVGLYAQFDVGAATTLHAFVTSEDAPGLMSDGTGYGVHVSHDLGGGVSIEGAATRNSLNVTQVQAGVYFSF